MPADRYCPMCNSLIIGRLDKKFCAVKCKSEYFRRLAAHTDKATKRIDSILKRNRSILQEIMGKRLQQIRISTIVLEKKKFNFTYITKYTINKEGKEYRFVYDFSYMMFSDDTVLINKRTHRRREY